ncbi:hypothetical protein GPECTOR_12g427 [Gonium pectorale]|uniref:Acyl carrier protein n=1 Tax=Gonium pectorale TaxID=33097 RepID=A0A150GNS8_GONPE|nr:hypothetical protein GPECTOR_12g427 [Gonium pectorale]|eukprot:KXZ51464.1 hypothetical protein GPECTOR_12g427 [Gonium pectorale]
MALSMTRKAVSARAAPARAQVVRPISVRGRRVVTFAAVDKAQVLADVRKIIAEQLGSKEEEVLPTAKFSDLGADSLDTVEIMMALEEKFEINLDEEGADKISTVQEAADLIANQVAAK